MTDSGGDRRRLERFEDLAGVDDEMLRQIGARVHIMDLAYAFGTADPALLDRLSGRRASRPGGGHPRRGADDALRAATASRWTSRCATAQSRVLEIARSMLNEPKQTGDPAGPAGRGGTGG